MIKIFTPFDESELAVARSILQAADIPHYIKNEHFGSLYIGPAISFFNEKSIYVPEEFKEEAEKALSSFIND